MSNKSRQNNEEVDLGQLFVMIGNTINRFFQFIVSILRNCFLVLYGLFFVKKHIVVFSVTATAGLIAGFIIEETSAPVLNQPLQSVKITKQAKTYMDL